MLPGSVGGLAALLAVVAAAGLGVPAARAQDTCPARAAQDPGDPVEPRERCDDATGGGASCAKTAGFRSVRARPLGGGLRLSFRRRAERRVTIDVFQHSLGRRVVGERRIARFAGRRRAVTFDGAGARPGLLSVRFVMRLPGGVRDVRRIALRRRGGRFTRRPPFYRRASCGVLSSFKLERPAFGGHGNRSLGVAFRLGQPARVRVDLRRRGRLVRRLESAQLAAGSYRMRTGSEGLARGDHVVRVSARLASGRVVRARLTSRRL